MTIPSMAYDETFTEPSEYMEVDDTDPFYTEDSDEANNYSLNDEFQTYYDQSTDTLWDRYQRAKMMYEIYEKFLVTAAELGKKIIEEIFIDSEEKTICSLKNIPGIAGGEKFRKQGIFFKLATDNHKLYNGFHYAMKSSGHEIKALNEILPICSKEIHFPMTSMINYYGFRIIAAANIPISKESIKYGSNDSGETVHNSCEKLNKIIEDIAEKLYLKEHVVSYNVSSDENLKKLYFPVDAEGHLGEDERYYLVDLQRLFPAEKKFSRSHAVMIDVDRNYHPISILRKGLEKNICNVLGCNSYTIKICTERMLIMYLPDENDEIDRNDIASWIIKEDIYGKVLVIHGEEKRTPANEYLYYMLRPEWLKRNHLPVSSDVYTKFGQYNSDIHEKDVEKLREGLINEVHAFTEWLVENSGEVVSALHLPILMHERGINLRFLGLIYTLIDEKYERIKYNVVGFAMLARVIKSHLQAKLRMHAPHKTQKLYSKYQSHDEVRSSIVEFFNLVLGQGEDSINYWKTIPIHLILKYGQFGFEYDGKEDFRSILGYHTLFELMQQYTGVIFNSDKCLNKPITLTTNDLEHIDVKQKRWNVKVLPIIKEMCEGPNTWPSELDPLIAKYKNQIIAIEPDLNQTQITNIISRKIHYYLVKGVFGKISPKSIASLAQIAECFAQSGLDPSVYIRKIFVLLAQVRKIPGEVFLSIMWIIGNIWESSVNIIPAIGLYEQVLIELETLFDSSVDEYSASPFELMLHNRLHLLKSELGMVEQAEEHKSKWDALKNVFSKQDLDQRVNNHIKNFLHFERLSGINLDCGNILSELENLEL
eukprot:TRINITY_DN2762_c0_g1_i1.p1 TRINITY_DN2762_c0_g1~~TRINITY_DN2762_c0_g1_i1.p1  ORF type:complete len:821 (+),score=142.00 TRINITY_DN2762_c0_g1_i1:65-2527(+)